MILGSPNSPRTSKINEKPLVFLRFLLFSPIAQNGKNIKKCCQNGPKPFQDPPMTAPRRLQNASRHPQRRLKTLQRRFHGAPTHLEDAPIHFQEAPRRLREASNIPALEFKEKNNMLSHCWRKVTAFTSVNRINSTWSPVHTD